MGSLSACTVSCSVVIVSVVSCEETSDVSPEILLDSSSADGVCAPCSSYAWYAASSSAVQLPSWSFISSAPLGAGAIIFGDRIVFLSFIC